MSKLKKYDEFAPKSPEFSDAQRLRLRNNLYSVNYKEIPATLDQFIKDPRYLGRATVGQDNVPGSAVFPVWQKEIPIFFSNNDKPFIVLTGAIGGGKSFAAVISILYVMHLHLCLRSPWGYYGLANASKMSIAFFNLTKTLSDSKGYGTMQKFLTQSPWFMEHGHVRGKDEKREVHFDLFEYVLASPYSRGFGCFGPNVKVSLLDGRELTIPQIMEERKSGVQHWVYSYDIKLNKMVPGKVVDAMQTIKMAKTVTVTLDNGESIECTEDHPFLKRNMEYAEAQDLKPGDSLMPLYRYKSYNGYEQHLVNSTGKIRYTHREFYSKKGYQVHHKNMVRTDNRPENIEVLAPNEHYEEHKDLVEKRLKKPINHKVVSVVPGEDMDVYDLTIEGFHNFALTAGVFVHNTVGKDIIAAIMDEVDSNTESENQKRRVLLAYESTVIRFESRFMREGKSLGRFFLVASKQDTVSFINTYVEKNKNTGRVHVVDKPAWEMKRGVMKYSGETFPIMVGDQFTPSKILYTQEEKALAIADRQHVIDVPVEYRFSFEMDITGALRDIAGISVTYTRQTKYLPNTKILVEAFTNDKPLFPAETLNVGCQEDYNLSVISLFVNANLKIQKDLPRFIHADWAKSGDAFGLAMTALAGWTEINVEGTDGTFTKKKVPVVHTDFAIRFKAKPGDEIPLSIIRKFVLDLKGFGFNVRKYTSDLDIASTSDRQILSQSGIECEYLSVDRTMTPYLEWKNMLQERRWSMPRHDFLLFEVSNLNIDRDKGKIDHPDEVIDALFVNGIVQDVVMSGSKDTADAVVGSVYALTSSLIEKDQPMDVEAMKNILSRIHDNKGSDEDKVTAFATMNGQFVSMGTGAGMVKFKNILRSVRK